MHFSYVSHGYQHGFASCQKSSGQKLFFQNKHFEPKNEVQCFVLWTCLKMSVNALLIMWHLKKMLHNQHSSVSSNSSWLIWMDFLPLLFPRLNDFDKQYSPVQYYSIPIFPKVWIMIYCKTFAKAGQRVRLWKNIITWFRGVWRVKSAGGFKNTLITLCSIGVTVFTTCTNLECNVIWHWLFKSKCKSLFNNIFWFCLIQWQSEIESLDKLVHLIFPKNWRFVR